MSVKEELPGRDKLEGKGEKRGYGGEEEQNALRISIYRKMAH
jgi:hypothetical protein